jgi:hypothetical protein
MFQPCICAAVLISLRRFCSKRHTCRLPAGLRRTSQVRRSACWSVCLWCFAVAVLLHREFRPRLDRPMRSDVPVSTQIANSQPELISSSNDWISPFESRQRVLKASRNPSHEKFPCLFKCLENHQKKAPSYSLKSLAFKFESGSPVEPLALKSPKR